MSAVNDDDITKGDEIALFRFSLISEIARMEVGSRGIYKALRAKAAHEYAIPGSSKTRVAPETLRTWLKLYRKHGFLGLKPKPRADRGQSRRIPAGVVDILLSLKENKPALTVKQVIEHARKHSDVSDSCVLKESTVHRLLAGAGLTGQPTEKGKDRRHFAYGYAGELFMSDVMHGPALHRDGKRKHKTYLVAFLDDATRMIPHAEFCWSENTASFFPVLKSALLRRGIPLRLYVDNGAAYRSRQLQLVCAKLGITLVHARPYQPQGKGKIERFFRTVRMSFLNQTHATSLEEMNRNFWAWVEGEYHQSPHRGLSGETPSERWAQVAGRINVVGPQLDLDDIFLWEVKRRVRSDRTVSLEGVLFEAVPELVGQSVTLRYDPSPIERKWVQVLHKGKRYPDARPVDARANCHVKRDAGVDFTKFDNNKE